MSNEPDRYDKLADTLFSGAMYPSPGQVAAALRQAAAEAMERAAQICRRVASDEAPRSQVGKHAALRCEELIGYARKSPAAAPAAEEPLGFCDWPGFKDHPHKKQEDYGRSDAEGNPLGCKNWRPAPPPEPAAPEKKPFACGADMESDGHLYRCDRGAGHTGSHGERDYAEWTDAEHHDGEPVAPSLLPRVLAALERRPDGYVLHCLVLELRRYIAGVGAGHAEAPDAERDRNRHNAMLVEAWREEFGMLCKVLFPGNDGPIGWKHVQAKVAALAQGKEPPRRSPSSSRSSSPLQSHARSHTGTKARSRSSTVYIPVRAVPTKARRSAAAGTSSTTFALLLAAESMASRTCNGRVARPRRRRTAGSCSARGRARRAGRAHERLQARRAPDADGLAAGLAVHRRAHADGAARAEPGRGRAAAALRPGARGRGARGAEGVRAYEEGDH